METREQTHRTQPSRGTRFHRPPPLGLVAGHGAEGFLLIATETMPAGLLPQIVAGLAITEGTAGQFVSAYALGTSRRSR